MIIYAEGAIRKRFAMQFFCPKMMLVYVEKLRHLRQAQTIPEINGYVFHCIINLVNCFLNEKREKNV